jgi:hypothetical protein
VQSRERRLVQLLCGTKARRRACQAEIVSLAELVDGGGLTALLERLNLLVLIGRRVIALNLVNTTDLERELGSVGLQARKLGAATELASIEVLGRLGAAGIRALPLKGSLLARDLYGDVGARFSTDVDVLVAPEDLSGAVAAISELGWRWEADVRREDGLPTLHEVLVHPTLPRVELHWRMHWYERRFAAEVLERAESPGPGQPLRMQPLDGLIALMLFYARDGFAGLRFPADAATWWDLRCEGAPQPSPVDVVAQRYPGLLAPVGVAAKLLSELVGLPVWHTGALPFRWRLAAGLASPFLDGGRQQAEANAGLIDLLLAPPNAAGDAMRRVLHNAPADTVRSSSGAVRVRSVSVSHVLRVVRRWALALVPAILRGYGIERPAR